MSTVQCVIAWSEEGAEWTGEPWRQDLGEQAPMRTTVVAHAVMWSGAADETEVAKGRAYASQRNHRVFLYPATESDPLGSARRDLLKAIGAGERGRAATRRGNSRI